MYSCPVTYRLVFSLTYASAAFSVVDVGARVTLDSPGELDLAIAAARASGRRARVALRLRPTYAELDQPSDFDPATTGRLRSSSSIA